MKWERKAKRPIFSRKMKKAGRKLCAFEQKNYFCAAFCALCARWRASGEQKQEINSLIVSPFLKTEDCQ